MTLRIFLYISLVSNIYCSVTPSLWESMQNFFSGFPERSEEIINNNEIMLQEYDFVLVGAGSGGSVLTNRLTENPDWKILVLEAGKDEIFLTDIPLLAPTLHITDYNWQYKSEPSLVNFDGSKGYCLSMVDGRCNFPRGKAVGGTSVVNFMIYSRGSPKDYDNWAAEGNPGWSYQEVLPYFIKSENSKLLDTDARFHGYGGYLDVMTPPYKSEMREVFLEAGEELGYDTVDYNSDRLIGFSKVQANLRYGHRVSASKAFLNPIRSRSNFHLSKHSIVTKIIVNPETKKAEGVEFTKNNKYHVVKATKEVILCAGTFNSPQLLMLSGIGPEKHLKSWGIDVIQDLPVGFNLQDHVSMGVLTFLINDTATIVEPRIALNPLTGLEYFLQGTGPLTLPAAVEGIAFIDTKRHFPDYEIGSRNEANSNAIPRASTVQKKNYYPTPDINLITVNEDVFKKLSKISKKDDPDIELVFGISALTGDISGFYRTLLGLKENVYREAFSEYEGMDAFTIVPILLHPKSRGWVSLRSSDPFQPPMITPNYYDHPDDLDTMIRGIRKAIEVASTKAFKRFNSTMIPKTFPSCKQYTFDSDPYWGCVCRHISTTLGHFIGTCKMGTKENSGVVDHKLRVHGIRGLRVVDASVIPQLMAGHTNAPVYMVAEKAADLIKADWNSLNS